MNEITIERFKTGFGLFSVAVVAIAMLLIGTTPLFGQQTDDVTVTVTLQNVAVSVSDGAVDYGTLGTSEDEDTTTNGINDSQTATNDGNVTVDLNILGQDTADWTLEATPDTDEYQHEFCTTDCDSSPSWTSLTTGYQTLASSLSASGDQVFDLQIHTPTSTSSFDQQSADVTVQASAP